MESAHESLREKVGVKTRGKKGRRVREAKPKPNVYLCSACGDATKTRTPECRLCGVMNGYQPAPEGTKLPKKSKAYASTLLEYQQKQDALELAGLGGDGKAEAEDEGEDEGLDEPPDVTPIGDIEVEEQFRIATGIKAFDRVLGGDDEEGRGVVEGSSVLLDGPPGIGKSTLLAQAIARIAGEGTVVYFTGEEKGRDIRRRADRLGLLDKSPAGRRRRKNLLIVETCDTDQVLDIVEEEEPIAIVLDSIQVFRSDNVNGKAGSDEQCDYILQELILGLCKDEGIAVFVVSQVTKDGSHRGTNVIAHMVDTHLKFAREDPDDETNVFRVLHAEKNRNGNVAEIAVFKMTGKGLVAMKRTTKKAA